MSEAEKLDIDLLAEDQSAGEGAAAVVDPNDGKSEDKARAELQAQFDDLKRQREADQKAREEAERRAQEAAAQLERERAEGQRYRSEVEDSRLRVLDSAIAAAKTETEMAQADQLAAMEAGDWRKAADAQGRLALAAAKFDRMTAGREALQERIEEEKARAEDAARRSPQRVEPADPVERAAASLKPRAAAWVRAHPDYVTDPAKNAQLMAAHWNAIASGASEGSDDYFSAVEGHLGLRDGGTTATASAPRRASAPAAPVSRDVPSSDGGGSRFVRNNKVTLTPQQQEAAKIAGMTNAEYAKALLDSEKRGAFDYSANNTRH